MNIIRCVLALLLILQLNHASAGDCQKTGMVCTDSTPCKNVGGVMVCLANAPTPSGAVNVNATCWDYQDTYQCLEPNAVNYCYAISQIPGCFQTNSTCSQTAFNGSCMANTNTYSCTTNPGAVTGSVFLNASYTITNDTLDASSCSTYAQNSSCTLAQHTCTDSTPCKTINGLTVCLAGVPAPPGGQNITDTCWTYSDSYSCIAQNNENYCTALVQAGCSLSNQTCTATAWNGSCMSYEKTYSCGNQQGSPLPTNVTYLNTTYTISQDTLNTTQCDPQINNPNCTLATHTCTDATPCKTINGLTVCLQGITPPPGGQNVSDTCWNWSNSYTCVTGNYQNYCTPLQQLGCQQTAHECQSYAWNNTCMSYMNTYSCGSQAGQPLPNNVTYLNTTYTIAGDNLNTTQCDQFSGNANCTLASSTCTDATPCKTINGLAVCLAGITPPPGGQNIPDTCWNWTKDYTCASTALSSDCGKYQNNPACTQTGTNCIQNLPGGQCGVLEHDYSCKVKDGYTQTTTTCDTGVCVNNVCNTPTTNPDKDFAKVITGMEAAREMGVYLDPANVRIFKGTASSCTDKLGGVISCCQAETSGGDNPANAVLMMVAKKFVVDGITNAVETFGSEYMYDALYDYSSEYFTAIVGAGAGDIVASGSGESLFGFDQSYGFDNFYGISASISTDGTIAFGFDPYSFAIAVAIQIVMNYLQCDQQDKVLAMRKGQRLCTYVGSWCDNSFLGVCLTAKEGYCCYNSRLARIVNEQGRAQLGKSYGSPQNPDCSGFSPDEIGQLDFGQMDLSEFFDEIKPKSLDTNIATQRANNKVNSQIQSYFGSQ